MTPHEAARHFAASLLEAQLAAAHVEGPDGDLAPERDRGIRRARIVLETFDGAPPAVAAWIARATEAEKEKLVKEMEVLAGALRSKAGLQ